jgi:hypothetical protein
MKWAIIGVLGFLLEIGAVIWLARSNTAQWERDHRAARAEVRAREEAGLRVRAAAAVAQRVPPVRRLPHPHLSHIPHVHLSPWVVDRLAHTREVLHRPRLHLPHRTRTRLQPRPEAPVPAPRPEAQVPAPAPDVPVPAPAPDDASAADTPSQEQATP